MNKLHLFLSAIGGIYMILLLADRYFARRKKNKRDARLLTDRAALAAGVVYFAAAIFTKSVGLVIIGFLMIIYSSVTIKMLDE